MDAPPRQPRLVNIFMHLRVKVFRPNGFEVSLTIKLAAK